MLPQRADSFDPSAQNPLDVTLAQLKRLDRAKYDAIKVLAEDAVQVAWERALARRARP